MPQPFNLAAHFLDRHVVEGRGGKVAIRCEQRSLTYGQIADQTNRMGNRLRKAGVAPGDRVLLLLPDSPEFVAAWFAAIKIGAVAVPTSTALRAPDYAHFLDESRARALVVDSTLWPQIEPVARGRAKLECVIMRGEQGARGLADESPALEPAPTRPDEIAFWLWTSGSTGPPKAAIHRHQDWMHCCENYARAVLGIHSEDVTFSSSKLFHAYGLGNGLMFPFHVGATTVLYPGRPAAQAILQCANQTRPTLFFSVPTLYSAMLLETDRENPYNLSSVRLGVSAAEPLPAEIFLRWRRRFGFELLDGIGSTEALHIYASARAGQCRPGSTGAVVPGYEIRIRDERGMEVAPGQIGDLWVRGASVAPCYWNHPELSSQRMRNGWFFTGDKYYADQDGYLWYAGRSDDMFRVGGEWVSPFEVESALAAHPAVLESAVVAFQDASGLTKPKAFVVLKSGGSLPVEELQAFVKQRIAPYKYPRWIEFVSELPKTATGKIQRFKLRPESRP